MARKRLWAIAGTLAAGLTTNVHAAIWYVDSVAPSGGDGTSASTAYRTIQEAVDDPSILSGDVIRVGGGTISTPKVYHPSSQFSPITLRSGVRIEGGWQGYGHTDFGLRVPDTYITTLSGNLGGGVQAEHVILAPLNCAPPSGITVADRVNLDGVTVTGGYAEDLGGTSIGGGGILIAAGINTKPVIRDCLITGNSGVIGGGIFVGQSSKPVFRRCRIINNTTDSFGGSGGGGAKNTNAEPVFLDCLFESNTSIAANAGGFYVGSGGGMFYSCTFIDNTAASGGGAMDIAKEHGTLGVLIANCKFVQNTAGDLGGAISARSDANVTIKNCTFSDNVATNANSTGGALDIRDSATSVTMHNSILWDNVANTNPEIHLVGNPSVNVYFSNVEGGWSGTGSDNIGGSAADDPLFDSEYRLQCGSPSINEGSDGLVADDEEDVDENLNATEDAADLDLNPRKVETVDMGAYERQIPQPDCAGNIVETGNNCVGVPDLLAVINQWGPCDGPCILACPGACTADIVRNCVVNTADLLAVINDWGYCLGGECEGQPSSPSEVIDCLEICDGDPEYSLCVQKCLCGLGYVTPACDD